MWERIGKSYIVSNLLHLLRREFQMTISFHSLILKEDMVLDGSSAMFLCPENEGIRRTCARKDKIRIGSQKRNNLPLPCLYFSCKEVKAEIDSESKLSRFTSLLLSGKCFRHHKKNN